MDNVTVRVFDPATASPDDWRKFHALRRERAADDFPGIPISDDAIAEGDLRRGDPLWCARILVAHADGAAVGRAQFWWRRDGSPDHQRFAGHAMASGGVMQAFRRRGIATRLAQGLLACMQEQQVTVTTFRVPDPARGQAFLTHLGARETYRDIDNRLALADARWPELERWSEAIPSGLRWEVHAGRVPVERLHELAPAITAMLADVPRGSSDHPRPTFDADEYRGVYERMDARGGKHLLVLLLAGGTPVAVCEATWNADVPAFASQLFTGVARPFRGQGLALAVKARMLQAMREHLPGVAAVATNNAVDNAPMLHVNARLGFRPARESALFQLRRDALEARLATPGR